MDARERLIQWSMSAGGGASVQYGRSWSCERERFPGRQLSVSLPHLRLAATWDNGVEHSGFLCFADTEEVTGSNPVAPTNKTLTRAFVDHFAPPMDRGRQREVADGRESVSLFNQGVHLGSQLSAGPHTSPDVDLDLCPGPLSVSPTRLL
jgi:hypothetical protein